MRQPQKESKSEFQCPACERRYRLRPEMTGKKVRCTCGREIVIPAAQSPAEKTTGPANQPDAPAPLGGLLTQAMSNQSSAVERALKQREDDTQPSLMRDRYLPWAMLAVGVVGCYLLLFIVAQSSARLATGKALALATLALGLAAIIYLPLAIVSASYIGRLMSCPFGELKDVAIKLAGLTILAAFAADTPFFIWLIAHEFDYRVLFMGVALYFAVFGSLLWLLFGTDLYESVACSLLLIAPRMVAAFTVAPMVNWWISD